MSSTCDRPGNDRTVAFLQRAPGIRGPERPREMRGARGRSGVGSPHIEGDQGSAALTGDGRAVHAISSDGIAARYRRQPWRDTCKWRSGSKRYAKPRQRYRRDLIDAGNVMRYRLVPPEGPGDALRPGDGRRGIQSRRNCGRPGCPGSRNANVAPHSNQLPRRRSSDFGRPLSQRARGADGDVEVPEAKAA